MRTVWVKGPGEDVRRFPLLPSGHLMLDDMAERWNLNPDSLRAGKLLLHRDSSGHSDITLDEIASLLPPENNGLSMETPLLITGCGASSSGVADINLQSRSILSKKRMIAVCDQYLETVKHVLKALPREEAEYKARFPSSVVDVCTVGDVKRPCLLWDGVGGDSLPLDQRFVDWQERTGVTVLLAPSGSGKTRMLLEVGSRRLCLFLTGHKPSITGGLAAASSADVSNAVEWVEERVVLFKQDSLEEVLTFATGALLITRLAILAFLRDLMPTQNRARDWVFFQAEYPSVRDVFEELLARLLETTKDVRVDFPRSTSEMQDLVQELALKVGWDGLVILDESQSLLERLPNRFLASSGQRTNPVLIPLIGTLSSFAPGPKFVSGTGSSMMKVRERLISGSMKHYDVREVYSLGGFSGADDLREYMRRYIDISGLDMELLGITYRGRRRWLVTALEHFMENAHPRGSETSFFMTASLGER